MTPLQALIKNLVTIGLLILPLTKFKNGMEEKKNFSNVLIVGLAVTLLMFMLIPQGATTVNEVVEVEAGESEYSVYFEDIGKENKLLCFFSPTCEHCMEAAKKLTELKAKFPGIIPEINILFMDEAGDGSATDVKTFFEFIGAEYTYKVLSVEEFIEVFWNDDNNFPGVMYLYNGEERIFFDGSEGNEFDADKLLEEIKKEY
jgi:thiol-disulfide isomerase/thioredoxin